MIVKFLMPDGTEVQKTYITRKAALEDFISKCMDCVNGDCTGAATAYQDVLRIGFAYISNGQVSNMRLVWK